MHRMLDLFSGLGGASEAMVQSASWEVLRIENNPLLHNVPETTISCVHDFRDYMKKQIEECGQIITKPLTLLWASIPCTYFSTAYSSPRSVCERGGGRIEDDQGFQSIMELVETTKELIELLKPKYWIIENVHGSGRFLEPYFGKPKKFGSFLLYGKFPAINVDQGLQKFFANYKKPDAHSGNPLRANIRAKVPFELSNAVCQSIEAQKTLDYWF